MESRSDHSGSWFVLLHYPLSPEPRRDLKQIPKPSRLAIWFPGLQSTRSIDPSIFKVPSANSKVTFGQSQTGNKLFSSICSLTHVTSLFTISKRCSKASKTSFRQIRVDHFTAIGDRTKCRIGSSSLCSSVFASTPSVFARMRAMAGCSHSVDTHSPHQAVSAWELRLRWRMVSSLE